MHLLAAKPGAISDGTAAVDLGQTPGEIVILSSADTELACLAAAQSRIGARARLGAQSRLGAEAPQLRLANLLQLSHNLSVDLYVEQVIQYARLVILRLLGGSRYWPYGVEQIAAICRERGIAFAALPGDDRPDPELSAASTLPVEATHRLWRYCGEGGVENAVNLLNYGASLIGREAAWREPMPLLRAGLYWPGRDTPGADDLIGEWRTGRPAAMLVFYRALIQAGNTAVIDALIAALDKAGLDALPVYVTSLKEDVAAEFVAAMVERVKPAVILNATAFAIASPGAERSPTPFDGADAPVLQVVFSGGSEADWRAGSQGLSARDLAMHVVLPEVDGRILSRAVSFKAEAAFDPATQCSIVAYRPLADRIDFVARLAANWARLRRTAAGRRRVAILLANYPNRDGRIGNGVGLDTPAGTIAVLDALSGEGYRVDGAPQDAQALMARLLAGPTNSGRPGAGGEALSLAEYRAFLETLPAAARDQVEQRWGKAEDDPFIAGGQFHLPIHRFGNVAVAVQPARGYNIDPARSYHDPDLVPPHGYLAVYAWLRRDFEAHAIIHMGKHGNLEWLPGKALALSSSCWPEAPLGPLPHLYPFIVNDPGEGSQAKRRAAAVIIDHLTPPLTRAESYGPLRDLERLVDEYYEAAGLDPRRCKLLRDQILELAASSGLDKDCGISTDESADTALSKLDGHLCDLKELQIRDGLHVFGHSPAGLLETDLLVALTRLPRGDGRGKAASLIRALAKDLSLADPFDPLDCEMAAAWTGARPDALKITDGAWRSQGDTVERLEILAQQLVAGEVPARSEWTATADVLDYIARELRPRLQACGKAEIAGLLAGLAGRFVAPGPSGAPTRGRPEVLPTGRNFYSVDTRLVPTPAAWHLGWKSASLLLERYRQEHGNWPKSLALSAWGTANMRTGGDDIAQALALMGVRPSWDANSGRLSGFEILPLSILDRPRVDVTLRISGFFRDAFPQQVDLVASAARAVAELDEPPALNPLAERAGRERAAFEASGLPAEQAAKRAALRVFGSKPGAYGAGLQALIDERGWQTGADLARAYIAWGGYAYGDGAEGAAEHRLFETRLGQVEGVLHNQDNREHDLFDSDDYYQFEGGLAVTVKELSGRKPAVYHNDHSRPESPRIRRLEEEVARIVRGRVVNPKWIAGVMRHGYKGAFEIAATVDYMFAFAATTGAVADHHFDLVYQAYLGDPAVRDFLLSANRDAAREMAERLLEAMERGLWRPRLNAAFDDLTALRAA
jgi:cobaltochelatase CobN